MKKYLTILLSLLLCTGAILSLVACDGAANSNKKDENKDEQTTTAENGGDTVPDVDPDAIYAGDYFAYDLSSFIDVPDISTVVVPKSLVDQLLELNTALTLTSLQSFTEVASGEVANNYDTVNIAFEGRAKDESVELSEDVLKGMKSESYNIMIGSGNFIGAYDHPTDDSLDTEGFEDQMIGMKVGETKDILTTFPDNYGESALAGLQVIFTVTVNSAKRPKPIDEETAKAQGYESVEAFNEELVRLTKSQAALEYVIRSSTVKEYPVGDLETLVDYYIDSYIDYYYGSGITNEEADRIREALSEDADTWAKGYAKDRMIIKRITDMQGIKTTEKDLADYAQKEAEAYGLTSGDTLIAYYGKDTVWFEYIYELAVEIVENNVKFEE